VGIAFISSKRPLPGLLRSRFLLSLAAMLALPVFVPAARAQEMIARLDPAQTKIEFTLGATFHTVHGIFKLKSGTIQFDPSTGAMQGVIIVDATSGDSGNGIRDRRMHREILESGRFPEITFTPRKMTGALSANIPSKLEIAGQLRLHGLDHDVTIPVNVLPDGRQLHLTARLIIPFVQWGLKDPSTFFLRVSNKVTIDIDGVGRFTNAGGASPGNSPGTF